MLTIVTSQFSVYPALSYRVALHYYLVPPSVSVDIQVDEGVPLNPAWPDRAIGFLAANERGGVALFVEDCFASFRKMSSNGFIGLN